MGGRLETAVKAAEQNLAERPPMKQRKIWLPLLLAFSAVALTSRGAGAQPKPITACGLIISASGSYILNGNLTSTSAITNCIDVSTSWVTINLNGFTVTGKGGTATGIYSNFGALRVFNGSVNGFGVGITAAGIGAVLQKVNIGSSVKAGASLGNYARVSGSQFQGNGTGGSGDGLDVGHNAVITHCVFSSNKGNGLKAGGGLVVAGSTAANNSQIGFMTGGSSVIKNNTASANGTEGFCDDCNGGTGSTFRSDVATANRIGIEFYGSTVIGNNASNNNDIGIADDGLSTVANNTASGNAFFGFVSSDLSTFTGNTGSANTRIGFFIDCPVNLIGNTGIDPSGNHVGSGCNLVDNLGF
jgi:hypothetical protein